MKALKPRVKEVLAELEFDSFKNTVLQELKEGSKRKSHLQHPAFLLILGFVLTGGVGTWLTTYWQSQSKENERAQLAHERAIQQKYDVANDINKAVSEAYAGAHVMIGVLSSTHVSSDTKEVSEREAYWKQSARSWVINSLILRQKLAVNFKNKEAITLYGEIIDDAEELNIKVREGFETIRSNKGGDLDQEQVQSLLDMADGIREKTQRLLVVMVEEIHREEGINSDTPATVTRQPTS